MTLDYVHREWYHDYNPEHLVGLYSMEYEKGPSSVFYMFYKFFVFCGPVIAFLMLLVTNIGAHP